MLDKNIILSYKNNYNKNAIDMNTILKISRILKYVNIKNNTTSLFKKNNIVGILNKLTDDNKIDITKQLLELVKQDNKCLDEILETIFINSIKQCKYITNYMYLLKNIHLEYSNEMNQFINLKIDEFIRAIEDTSNENNNSSDICQLFKNTQYINGYTIFITQLYNNGLMDSILLYFNKLTEIIIVLDNNEQKKNLIESLFNIINSCTKSLLTSHDIEVIHTSINKIKSTSISNKSKFQLMDIKDLLK